ncbi:glycosyltransferase family 2 protein [Lachnoclostridium pacaense]|uniref:glycosyltransferase family 2 protein n=1 Tax=Enterocloster hominis (ex Hitch et al. 2024) TaxID=1917870 RepID=UPI001D0F732D|nr:glycosyltransferase family 2 protein [Lachnoclostridium pacaense]MCC2877472.1 glycosyltransferase family 2 protein [Lachnoclostridium pacaense]
MDHGITVLAAAYNGRDYIEEQMDSILAQGQGGILLVVSDDGSTDDTGELLDQYGLKHRDCVLVLHRRTGSGGAAAHFLGLLQMMASLAAGQGKAAWEGNYDLTPEEGGRLIRAASSDYFMLSDQDDVWLPCKVQMLLGKMQELEGNPPDSRLPVLVHSDLKVVDEQLNEIAPSFFGYQKISPERTRLSQLLVQNNVTGGAVMMNRPMLGYLEQLPGVCLMHDAWLALLASCFGRIGWVGQPLYLYRQHRDNTLGAEKGDSLKGAGERIRDGSRAKENYRLMFGQAGCLLAMFRDKLDPEQREILAAFTELPGKGRLGRIALMMRYGFTKNSALRTIGQMLFMGD